MTPLLLSLILASPPAADVLGTRVVDVDGACHRLGGPEGAAPTVLVFLGPECPISQRFSSRLNELAEEARELGMVFFGIVSEPHTSGAEAREYRDTFELGFPILFDASGDLAHVLEPERVPEAFLVGTEGTLYRGRIDDRFAAVGKLRPRIDSHDLLEAMRTVASGEAPAVKATEAVGCIFESWTPRPAAPGGGPKVTYTRDIAPMLAANCLECHREGDVAPFELGSYEDVKRRAHMIAEVCESGYMPPWNAERGYGHFRDERGLSRPQIARLRRWVEEGAERGDPEELLPAPAAPETRWRLGEPDFIVSMPVDYEIPAEGEDIYRYFHVPSELTENRPVVAVDFRPGDPAVVHHCLAYLDPSGNAKKLEDADPEPGFALFGTRAVSGDADFLRRGAIAGWAPGKQPYRYPEGLAMELPGGVDFVLEVHYHLTGKPTSDRSELAFYFADQPVERYVEGLVIGTEQIDIAPGDGAYGRRVWMELPSDVELIQVTPHMHYLGREVEAYAELPDGTQEPLIRIDDWDFRWQDTYVYREPVRLPEGTILEAFFRFDNSAENPFNPSDPPARVKEGWQTTDEMCLFYFTVVPRRDEDRGALQLASFQSFLRPSDP